MFGCILGPRGCLGPRLARPGSLKPCQNLLVWLVTRSVARLRGRFVARKSNASCRTSCRVRLRCYHTLSTVSRLVLFFTILFFNFTHISKKTATKRWTRPSSEKQQSWTFLTILSTYMSSWTPTVWLVSLWLTGESDTSWPLWFFGSRFSEKCFIIYHNINLGLSY